MAIIRARTVESAIAEALEGVSARDRIATKRVLERLADHLERPAPQTHKARAPRRRPTTRRGQRGRAYA